MEPENLLVKQYSLWTLFLNQHQNYLGRCYLALNRDGNLDPFVDCTPQEWVELHRLIGIELNGALSRLFNPDLLNYASLQNVWHHCHWHIVPRYEQHRTFAGVVFTDVNWGKNWAPYDKDFVVADSVLLRIRTALESELG